MVSCQVRAQGSRRAAFTAVEMVVVVAVIGILVALILPAIQNVRAASRQTQCKENLRQIGVALQHYETSHHVFPPGWIGPAGWSWTAMLLPYMDEHGLYKLIGVAEKEFNPPEAKSENDAIMDKLRCPDDFGPERSPYYGSPTTRGYAISNYPGNNGDDQFLIQTEDKITGIFGLGTRYRMQDITDGLGTTFAVGERHGMGKFRAGIWMRATNVNGTFMQGSAVAGTCGVEVNDEVAGRLIGFSSNHQAGINFLMCDGKVYFIKYDIDEQVFRNLANREDGHFIDDEQF